MSDHREDCQRSGRHTAHFIGFSEDFSRDFYCGGTQPPTEVTTKHRLYSVDVAVLGDEPRNVTLGLYPDDQHRRLTTDEINGYAELGIAAVREGFENRHVGYSTLGHLGLSNGVTN